MASTAATVFFCRPGRMSLRAVLTGFFDCAHVVCAIAGAARNSKAGITTVLFILSSFQFGFQLAFSKRMLCHCYGQTWGYIAFGKNHITADNSNCLLNRDRRWSILKLPISISFASSPLVGTIGHSVIP